jgi:hypothetical protein
MFLYQTWLHQRHWYELYENVLFCTYMPGLFEQFNPPVTPDANGLGPGVIAAIVVAALVTAGVLAGAVGVALYPSWRAYLTRFSHDH